MPSTRSETDCVGVKLVGRTGKLQADKHKLDNNKIITTICNRLIIKIISVKSTALYSSEYNVDKFAN